MRDQSDTPETDECVRMHLAISGITPTQFAAALSIRCESIERERNQLREMLASGTEADVCRDIAERQKKGTVKYGLTVAENPLPLCQWLQHAYEEALDMAIYLKRAQHSRNEEPDPEPTRHECDRAGEGRGIIENV